MENYKEKLNNLHESIRKENKTVKFKIDLPTIRDRGSALSVAKQIVAKALIDFNKVHKTNIKSISGTVSGDKSKTGSMFYHVILSIPDNVDVDKFKRYMGWARDF